MARKIYRGYARDGNGTILSSATVYVYLTGTSTAASVYTASSGGTAVNSVTSDSTGLYSFYTDYSDYTAGTQFRIVISKTGYDSVTYDEVECLPPTFSTDGTLTDNSDADFPSEKAVKTYVDATVSAAANVSDLEYDSAWDGVTTLSPSKNAVYDKVETLMDLNGANLAVGSDATGDVYYYNSGLARLGIGTAGQYLATNTGATAPEWATPVNNFVQCVSNSKATVCDCSTIMPVDNTIPQNTEGDEVLTQAITPKSATNLLVIIFQTSFMHYATVTTGGMALFQDDTANALAAVPIIRYNNPMLVYKMVAGTTSETTFKIRVGPTASGHVYLNTQYNSTTLSMSTVTNTTLTILEFAT
jgi:hypothetical protein